MNQIRQYCDASIEGYTCTLAPGHDGAHKAGLSDGRVVAEWAARSIGSRQAGMATVSAAAAVLESVKAGVECPETTVEWDGTLTKCSLLAGHTGQHDDGCLTWLFTGLSEASEDAVIESMKAAFAPKPGVDMVTLCRLAAVEDQRTTLYAKLASAEADRDAYQANVAGLTEGLARVTAERDEYRAGLVAMSRRMVLLERELFAAQKLDGGAK